MVKKFLILFIFALFVFLPFKVNAQINVDGSYYSYIVPEDELDSQFYPDINQKELLDYYSSYESQYFDIMVIYSVDRVNLRLYNKNTNLDYNFYCSGGGSCYFRNTVSYYYISIATLENTPYNFNYFTSNTFNEIKQCLDSRTCNSSLHFTDNINLLGRITNGEDIPLLNSYTTINNNDSYDFELMDNIRFISYFYSSQVPIKIKYTNLDYGFIKTLILNGKRYYDGDSLLTYTDIYSSNEESSSLFLNEFTPYLVGGISKNDISSFNLSLDFSFSDVQYINDLIPNFYFFGRKNNNTYYSYDKLSCQSINNYQSLDIDSESNHANLILFPNGFSCSDDLTSYDNIYLRIDLNYSNSLFYDTSIYNLHDNVSKGYGKFFNSTLINYGSYTIFEKFNNLSDDFSLNISTNANMSYFHLDSSNKYTVAVPVNRTNLEVSQGALNEFGFGSFNNTSVLIFNYPNNDSLDTNIDLLFTSDSILSFSNNGSYTYYDNTNTLTTSNINNDIIISFYNNYDVEFYDNVVANYISSLSDDILQVSQITQMFYDSLPISFQSLIYVLFILICFYFVYLLIKRR